MAKNFLVDINLNKNELQNGVIQNLAADPANGVTGQLYYNTAVNKLKVYNGSEWIPLEKGTGTVTNVAVQNDTDGGITVSGSPITTSGTITLGHSNVLSGAQTTQAIYPITYDKNGHITGAGTAFNPATKQNVINDLDDIRSGAAAGATAVQPEDLNEYAPLASPALTGTPTAPTAASGTSTTQIATTAFVQSAISGISGAMHFKGTVGTGGTAGTTLPTTGVTIGDTYKICSDGTYVGQAAKIGDLFIATATTPTWAYVPSGDETGITSVTAGAGLNTTSDDTFTDGGTITSTGTIYLTKTMLNPGTYSAVTVDKYGRVTEGANVHLLSHWDSNIVGDGTTTTFTQVIEPGYGHAIKFCNCQVYDYDTKEEVVVDISTSTLVGSSTDITVTISFGTAPANGKKYSIRTIYEDDTN